MWVVVGCVSHRARSWVAHVGGVDVGVVGPRRFPDFAPPDRRRDQPTLFVESLW